MSVTVVVPAFNAAPYIAETVESALAQTARVDEVIVIDDGSTDDTAGQLRPYLDRIRYVRQVNRGVSEARNHGWSLARSAWVLFLDADDVLLPDALEHLLSRAGPAAPDRIVYGNLSHIDERGACIRAVRSADFTGPVPEAARKMFANGAIPPATFLVPRWVPMAVGGFDPRFAYAQDLEMWLRCSTAVPFVHADRHVLRYRVHGTSVSRNVNRAMRENIDVRLAFQDWCDSRGLQVLDRHWTESALLESQLARHFNTRNWEAVDGLLHVAAERSISSPRVEKLRRLRRVPAGLFRVKDSVDRLRGSEL